jgi:probable F420-dependent oxidoreductase
MGDLGQANHVPFGKKMSFTRVEGMLIGFGAPVAGAWATPGYLRAFAERAEDAGYASLWTFQRLLVPEGSRMEPVYRSVLDPMIALGYVAASTSRIRLGVAVINLPFVSPAVLAKQATAVDVLSGGRLDLGLGLGWMPEEFAAAGATTARRGARTEEYLGVLRTLWSDEVSSFTGEFYTVPAGRQDPRPVQRPGPPVLLGGISRPAIERAGRIADGWITSSRADLSAIGDAVTVIRDAASEAGRDPGALRIICRGVTLAGDGVTGPDGGRRLLSGSFAQIREDAAWLAEQGVTELFYDLNWDPQVGNPAVEAQAAAERADEILAELAPR